MTFLGEMKIGVSVEDNALNEFEKKLKRVTSSNDKVFIEAVAETEKARVKLQSLQKEKEKLVAGGKNTIKIDADIQEAQNALSRLGNAVQGASANIGKAGGAMSGLVGAI